MSSPFESQKISARNLVLSANKQAAYGGALADGVLLHRQRFDGSSVLELTPSRRSDKTMTGKGTEFATDGQLTGWDTKFSFKAELDAWLAGFAFALTMGKETVTGSGAPYTHAIAFDESTSQQAATTVYLEDTHDVHYKVPDLAVTDLSLSIPERGACMLDLGFLGTGRYSLGSMGSVPALAASSYLLGSDCAFTFGPAGSAVDITGRHLSTTLKITTGVQNHVAPGGGLFGVFTRHGIFGFNIQTVIAAKDTDDIFTLFANDTLSDLKWTINSGAQAQLVIETPAAKFKANKLGKSGANMVIWSLELDDTTCYSVGGAPPLTVSVINAVVAYLTAS